MIGNRGWWRLAAGVGAALAARALWRQLHAWDLRDRVVMITGGSRGLGLALAREFGRQGAIIALCSRDEEEVNRAIADLDGRSIRAVGDVCDVTDLCQVLGTVGSFEDALGRIDVLINNAGVIQVGPVDVMTLDDYEEAMAAHFWAPVYTTLSVLPGMRRRRQGRIVNIASIGGKVSVPHLIPYDASKFALVGFSEGLTAELARDGIGVTTVIPGLMRTGSPRNAIFKGQHRAEYAWFKIGDSLPLLSMSAARAARQIVRACRVGDAEVVLGLPAKAAVVFHGLFPGLTARLLGLINRVLPERGGIGTARARGEESVSGWSESWLTVLTQQAEREYNEIGVGS
jgi:NAD(P)-dependent dehydrogenase (short-subunit alcohol dehydrogenase family)